MNAPGFVSALAALGRDLRAAVRVLRTNRGLTVAASVTLALGMGVTLGVLGVVDSVLLRPLDFREPDRLVLVWGQIPGLELEDLWLSGAEYRDLAERSRSFEELSILRPRDLTLTGTTEPEPIRAVAVTGNFFRLLGVDAAAGRALEPADDRPGAGRVAVLAHGTARRLFGGAAQAVGQTVELNRESYDVLGVMPAGFQVPPPADMLPRDVDLWVPVARDVSRLPRDWWIFGAMARLAPGVSLEAAGEEVSALARRASDAYPETYQEQEWDLTLVPYQEYLARDVKPALLILLAMVALVLLIACANVTSLLLALAMAKRREIALRAAVGAGRWALVRRSLAEPLLLAAIGSILALGVASGVGRALALLGPEGLSGLEEVRLDGRLAAYGVTLAFVVCLLTALGPALRSARPHLTAVLRDDERAGGGHAVRRSLRLLVIAEVALALVPLVATGLLGKSMLRMGQVDPGFASEAVLTGKVRPAQNRYRDDGDKAILYDRILERVRTLPGVTAAGATTSVPMSGLYTTGTFAARGAGVAPLGERFQTEFSSITPGYFEALDIPVRAGRAFGPLDDETGAPVAILDETLARRLWPEASPLGKEVRLLAFGESEAGGESVWHRVVGVVPSVRGHGLGEPAVQQVYFPLRQVPWVQAWVVARTEAPPESLIGALRRAVHAVDPDQAVADPVPLDDYVRDSTGHLRFNLFLSGIFALLALLLAGLGTYGVMAYVLGQRVREIVIRLALGASPRGLTQRLVTRGVGICLVGIVGGVLLAAAGARVLGSLLFGVAPYDSAVFLAAPALLGAVAALACYLPARRLVTEDSMSELRP